MYTHTYNVHASGILLREWMELLIHSLFSVLNKTTPFGRVWEPSSFSETIIGTFTLLVSFNLRANACSHYTQHAYYNEVLNT